jgi:hypothetical protein
MRKVLIDNIQYELNEEERSASVLALENGKYEGNIVIPSHICDEGVMYVVTLIGTHAFYECNLLKFICLPDSIQEIGDLAFAGCINITHVHIPPNVTKIGEGVFGGCSSLESVFIGSMILKCIGESIFYNCIKLKTIYVHKDKQEEYCNLGLNEYRKLIVDSGEIKIQINHIANTKNSFFMDPEFVYNTIINKSQPIPKPVSTMSIAAFLTMKGCTPNEIRSGKVELRTTPSGVMRPAFVVKMVVLEVKEFVLYAHERYSLNTIEEMEKWIEDHNGKDLCVAYTDINNDLAYLCLKENKDQKLPNQKSATKAEYKIENTTENSSNTPSSNDGGSNDIGCIVLSVILAIAMLILTIIRTDSDTFATAGAYVMFAVCAIAGYFAYKRISEYTESKGCWPLIIGFVLFVILLNVIGYNYEVNTTIGIIVLVIVFVIGLIYFLSWLDKR